MAWWLPNGYPRGVCNCTDRNRIEQVTTGGKILDPFELYETCVDLAHERWWAYYSGDYKEAERIEQLQASLECYDPSWTD